MARVLRPRNLPLRRLSTALEQPAAAEMSIADLAPSLHRLKSCPSQTLTLETTTTLRDAAQHLMDNRLTFAMVLDEDRTVAGVLTERDLLRFATRLGDLQFFRPSTTEHRTSEWMTPLSEMLSVRLDHSLAHALAMTESGIWRQLPVLDYWDKLHSILDIRDVVEHVCDGIPGWKGKSVSDILSAKRLGRVLDDAVADPASTWPRQLERYLLSNAGRHIVPTSATIESAAKQIQKERLTFLVVTREEKGWSSTKPRQVAGLVTERSFLHYIASKNGDAQPDRDGVLEIATPLDDLIHVSLTDTAATCVDRFFEGNVRHLPVIEKGRLLGIISMRDLLRPVLEHLRPSFNQ